MKRLLLIPVVLMSMAAKALPNGWVVTVFTQAYSNLASPIVVPLAAGWDDPDVIIPLGFTHTAFGKSTSTMYIDGSNYSSGMDITTSLTGLVNSYSPGIDIMERSVYPPNTPSSISYKTEGSTGSKIAKIQWGNFGFYGENDIDGTLTDSANFQMWFYEGTNAVEYRFGPSYISDFERNVESTKLPIGLITNLDISGFNFDYLYYLTALNPAALDSFNLSSIPTVDIGINSYPVSGTVIRFSAPGAVGVNNSIQLNDELTFYPSIVSSSANVYFTNSLKGAAAIRVLDMSGKVVAHQIVRNQKNNIDLSHLAASNYMLQVRYQGQNVFYQFVKK